MATGDELEVKELVSESVAKKKVKFLCSHGGKILPRPADGHLKYVGGETRVVAVSRDITFSELKKRVSEVIDGDMVLKYQLIPEDLDMLVSVRSDEDLKHMLHEYDRMHHSADPNSSPKLRTFLFPSDHHDAANCSASCLEQQQQQQRYIDAVNGQGVGRGSSCRRQRGSIAPIVTTAPPPTTFAISSACSSPTSNSPEHLHAVETTTFMPSSNNAGGGNHSMSMLHKVQSSPSLYRPNSPHRPRPPQHNHCRAPPSSALSDRLGRPLSFGRIELRTGTSAATTRAPLAHGIDHYYTSGYNNINRQHIIRGLGHNINNNNINDDHLISASSAAMYIGCNRVTVDRAESLPQSPRKRLWD